MPRRHQGRREDRSSDECRSSRRSAPSAEAGADGIGLFRTELQFMIAAALPRTSEQYQLYRSVLDAAKQAGDVSYARYRRRQGAAVSARGAGGKSGAGLARDPLWRSTGPACCAAQVRALLQAAAGRELRIMFPMVALAEFDKAKALVERELTSLRRPRHRLPNQVKVGAMLEVPSLLFALDDILERARFSVGRVERSCAVPVRRRSRQYAGRRPLRSAFAAACCAY